MKEQKITTRKTGRLGLLVSSVLVLIVVGAGLAIYNLQRKNDALRQDAIRLNSQIAALQKHESEASKTKFTSLKGTDLVVSVPVTGSTVTSPLAVVGQVPGGWSFEASFPVKLLNNRGDVVASGPATVFGDWTSGKPVPFAVTLTWPGFQTGTGSLVLVKDNPSGLPANDDSLTIPVIF